MKLIAKAFAFFSGSNPKTWWGHFVQGVGLTTVAYWPSLGLFAAIFALMSVQPFLGAVLVGAVFVANAFNAGWWAQREFVRDLAEKVLAGEATWPEAWANFREDGALDFIVPVNLGGILASILNTILLYLLMDLLV